MNRLGDVARLNFYRPFEIGDGAANFEHAAVGPGADAESVDGLLQELFCFAVCRAVPFKIPGAHLGVSVDISFFEALELDSAGGGELDLPEMHRYCARTGDC